MASIPMRFDAYGRAICCCCGKLLGEDGRNRYCTISCRDRAAYLKRPTRLQRQAELESYKKTGVDNGEPEGVLVDRFAIEKAAPVVPWRASSLAAAGEKSAAADAMYRDGLVML